MSNRRLLGERVAVRVAGCPTRDGVLISGVKKQTKLIQRFHVRFPNGDIRTHRGDQILLRGSKAPLTEFVRVGDIIFTKNTLGVVRFVGKHEDFPDLVIVMEPIDPKLPTDPNVESFRKLFPSANLSDQNPYNILTKAEDILKMLPSDTILKQISNIKDKYIAFVEERKEKGKQYSNELTSVDCRIEQLEEFRAKLGDQKPGDEKPEIEAADMQIGSDPENAALESENEHTEPTSVSFTFNPGRLGIKAVWETGEVEGVSKDAQADHLGIKRGWRITYVDDEPYTEEILDAHTGGKNPYTLTFEVPPPSQADTRPAPPLPIFNPNPARARPVLSDEVKHEYEQKIRDLTSKIEESQDLVMNLETENAQMEKDHEEMTNLCVKVEQLRNSRVLFMSQIKTIKNRGKIWREKAEEFEKKYQKLLEDREGVDIKNDDEKVPPPGPGGVLSSQSQKNVEQDKKLGQTGSGSLKRKKSLRMPKPEPGNTLSLMGLGTSNGPSGAKGKEKKKRKKRASWFNKGQKQ